MNISVTDEQEAYIAAQIQGGDFQSASDVVGDALRLHQIYRHRIIEGLRAEIAKGWEGEASLNNVQDILNAKQDKVYQAKLTALRSAVTAGLESGDPEPFDVNAILKEATLTKLPNIGSFKK